MAIAQQLLFFVSGLGVFNGLLMSGYFLIKKGGHALQNQLFGCLLLMLSLRIGKSVLYFFQAELPLLALQLGLTACFFVGPFLFLYVRAVQRQQTRLTLTGWGHLLLAALTIGSIGGLFPYSERPDLWNPTIVQFIYAIWMGYVLAAAYYLWPILRKAFRKWSVTDKWLLVVWTTNTLICVVFHATLYLHSPSYIFGPITFSFVFYALLLFLIFFPGSKTVINGVRQRYSNKQLAANQAALLSAKLHRLMREEQLYTNANLKLEELARRVEVSPHVLSQFLNDNLGKGFSGFVNAYRIEAAGALLQTAQHLSVEGIGQEVGFRSKSAFYAAFRKIYGMTPRQFVRQSKVPQIRSEL